MAPKAATLATTTVGVAVAAGARTLAGAKRLWRAILADDLVIFYQLYVGFKLKRFLNLVCKQFNY